MSELTFASEAYLHAKAVWKGQPFSRERLRRTRRSSPSMPYGKGRDPHSIGEVLGSLVHDLGWSHQLSQSLLITEWESFVGPDVAGRTTVLSVQGATLHVQCDSTPWAVQLRRMRHQFMTKIHEVYPDAGIEDITFHGPHTPSWRHGKMHISGRGPRDTYG